MWCILTMWILKYQDLIIHKMGENKPFKYTEEYKKESILKSLLRIHV